MYGTSMACLIFCFFPLLLLVLIVVFYAIFKRKKPIMEPRDTAQSLLRELEGVCLQGC